VDELSAAWAHYAEMEIRNGNVAEAKVHLLHYRTQPLDFLVFFVVV
jgi:hypothetical protein